MRNVKKLTLLSVLVSCALVLHIVEGMIPVPLIMPGIKLGLANTISLLTIMIFGFKEVALVVILRCLLGSLFGGGISGFLFSISGGLLSAAVMYIIYRYLNKFFSIIGISIIGSVFHNIGQLFIASIIIVDFRIYIYLPVLMLSSVITGVFIGIVCSYLKKLLIGNMHKLGIRSDKGW